MLEIRLRMSARSEPIAHRRRRFVVVVGAGASPELLMTVGELDEKFLDPLGSEMVGTVLKWRFSHMCLCLWRALISFFRKTASGNMVWAYGRGKVGLGSNYSFPPSFLKNLVDSLALHGT